MTIVLLFVLCFVGAGVAIDPASTHDSVKAELIRHLEEGDFHTTVEYAEAAAVFYRKRDDLMDLAGCYMTLGNAYQRMGRYDDAIRNYNLCSETMDRIGGPMAKVNKRYVLNNMAAMHLEMGEYDVAEEMWNRCIASVNEADPGFMPQYNEDSLRSLDLATYYQNLAEVRLAQTASDTNHDAMVDDAIRFLEQSLGFSERYAAEQYKIVSRLTGLAQAYFEAGRTNEAQSKADTAMMMASAEGDQYLMAALHLLKGDMERRLGHRETAENHYLEALKMARENHFGEFEMEALRGAYECTKDSQPQRALAYFTESAALKDSIYNKEQQALIRDFEVRYKMEEKEHELAFQREKNRQGKRLLALSVAVGFLLLVLLIIGLRVAFLHKRRNEMKDHLLFVVSHDIKTPVVSQSQLLEMTCEHLDDMPKEEVSENLQVLKVSTDDLKDKLQNIIYWVKGEMGTIENHPIPFKLSEITQEVVDGMSLQAKMKNLAIHNEIPDDWLCLDDANVVRMVLQNLLSNAIKFSWPNGAIRITASEAEGRYAVAVHDEGKGIGKEKLERLLKGIVSFGQGTGGEMGTGIGLFVSQQLMERKGGEIKIESREGEGTTASFTVNKA